MTDGLVVFAPTRGRPVRAKELVDSFRATAEVGTSRLVIVVDFDDPEIVEYVRLLDKDQRGWPIRYGWAPDDPRLIVLKPSESGNLVKATNSAIHRLPGNLGQIVGHVGDDHRFRTHGWDREVTKTLRTPGIAYGDDGMHGPKLGTSWFVTTGIVEALGWLALPSCEHLYIDRVWKTLGERVEALRYLPDVSIEHMHPEAGKAEWDEGYRQANSKATWSHDKRAFGQWLKSRADADVLTVRAAMNADVARLLS